MSLKDRFREWLSDNLRYLLLILGILIVVIILYFGIGALTKDKKKSGGEPVLKEEQSKNKISQSDSTETPKSDQTKEISQELLKDGNAEISAFMRQYYDALSNKNIETLKSFVDNLSEKEQESISGESSIESYEDVESYTFHGQEEGTYVVIVRYSCKYKNIDTRAPGLNQMYVYTDKEGKLVIAAEVKDKGITDYMTDIRKRPDVEQLIDETQKNYDNARSQDAKLDALIRSVS